ncbi:MAG: hypothetical protein ACRDTV_12490 [Mycobacterium sp.]
MSDLPADVEQQLADMDEGAWNAFVAKVRAPDTREQLRTAASQVLNGPALDAFTDSADLSKFTGDDGRIDEERVMGRLTALFGTHSSPANFGQHSGGNPASPRPGDGGRAEAAKRFRLGPRTEVVTDPLRQPVGRGAAGRAEAARRFGKKGNCAVTRPISAQGNRYLAKVVDELAGHRTALDVAAQAQQMLDSLVAPEGIPADLHPLNTGAVNDEWVDASIAHTAAVAMLERRRGVLLELLRDANAQAASVITHNINQLLTRLNDDLTHLLDEARQAAAQLGGATTAEEAIAEDAGTHWKALTALAGEYALLREAQDDVMRRAPFDYLNGSRPANGQGEDHTSDLRLANLDQLWPDWRDPGIKTIRMDGGRDRLEPWPEDNAGLLLWLVTSPAQAWIPTLPQLDQLRTKRIARSNPMPKVIAGVRKPPINRQIARVV